MTRIGLIFIVVTITACASSLPPAGPSQDVMEQADTVILTVNEVPEVTHQNLTSFLINKGFVIKRSNIRTFELQTGYQEFGPIMLGILGSYSMRIFTTVTDSSVQFSGELNSGSKIENSGSTNSPLKASWQKLVEIAEDFPHQDMYFSRN